MSDEGFPPNIRGPFPYLNILQSYGIKYSYWIRIISKLIYLIEWSDKEKTFWLSWY